MTNQPTRAELRNEIVIAIRKQGVACPTFLLNGIMDAIESHDARLERAPWWREVTDPNEIIPRGCPVRFEYRGFAQEMDMLEGSVAFERVFDHVLKRNRIYENARLFIDTRWQPPVKPLKVGDLIETVEQAESLPAGTIVVTQGNAVFRKEGTNMWQRVDKERGFRIADLRMAGDADQIIYLPSGDSA